MTAGVSAAPDAFNGVLIVDKPAGFTSFDVVAVMRGLTRQKNRPYRHAGPDGNRRTAAAAGYGGKGGVSFARHRQGL